MNREKWYLKLSSIRHSIMVFDPGYAAEMAIRRALSKPFDLLLPLLVRCEDCQKFHGPHCNECACKDCIPF